MVMMLQVQLCVYIHTTSCVQQRRKTNTNILKHHLNGCDATIMLRARHGSRISLSGGCSEDGGCRGVTSTAAAAAGAKPPQAAQQASCRNYSGTCQPNPSLLFLFYRFATTDSKKLTEPRWRYHRLRGHLQAACIRSPLS